MDRTLAAIILPKVIIEIILLYCGYKEIIMFQDDYPQLLKHTKVLNIYDVNPINYKFIKHIKITAIDELKLLKYLDITKLDIGGAKFDPNIINITIGKLTRLTHLSCGYTRITDVSIKDLINLVALDCSYTKITDLTFFKDLVNLEQYK